MEETSNFSEQLESALNAKKQWFDTTKLPEILEKYRLLYTCVRTINELLVKKSIIIPDPYKSDKRISDIVIPETSSFSEQDMSKVLGDRFGNYEIMLDFVCNYMRFTVENLPIGRVKQLIDLNQVFQWDSLSTNSVKPNTRALANALSEAKLNAPSVTLSMLNDSVDKCVNSVIQINTGLSELATFQREAYKAKIRKDIIGHKDFKKETAFESSENEMAEIKRLYPKVFGKKSFYTDLINELIKEDQAPNKLELQQKVLKKLGINEVESRKPQNKGPDTREMLMSTIMVFGGIAPILTQLYIKLVENFELLFYVKKTFFSKLLAKLKKSLNIPDKAKVVTVSIVDQRSGTKTEQKIVVNELLEEIDSKKRVYMGFASKGNEYNKVMSASETTILTYINKQISENQSLYTVLNALDEYFKVNIVEPTLKPKVKGMKIDLSSYKNAVLTLNKKRSDYVSLVEEREQMRKLGMSANDV
ncbi:MAG: hypothetical protein MJ188_08430 [Treponema sp.]|nr:hypothetical protein [Treponema sp.]